MFPRPLLLCQATGDEIEPGSRGAAIFATVSVTLQLLERAGLSKATLLLLRTDDLRIHSHKVVVDGVLLVALGFLHEKTRR